MKPVIFKYKLYPLGPITITEKVLKFLHVANQGGFPTVWALVDPLTVSSHFVVIHGTGGDVENRDVYIGTCQCGDFVWHLFERTPE